MSETPERSAMDWEQRFRDDDTPWERGQTHPFLQHCIDSGEIGPGKSVIIPGCGRCPEVAIIARHATHTIAADLSETAIAWQGKQLQLERLDAELIVGDILEWRPEAPIDAVYEQTFLCAIPPRLRVEYEQAMHAWLKPGGKLLALFMQKEERGGPPYGCSLEAMHELFPEERWIWPPDSTFAPYPHPHLNDKAELAGFLTRR